MEFGHYMMQGVKSVILSESEEPFDSAPLRTGLSEKTLYEVYLSPSTTLRYA